MLDPMLAHRAAMSALAPVEYVAPLRSAMRGLLATRDPRLEVRKMGLVFPNPTAWSARL